MIADHIFVETPRFGRTGAGMLPSMRDDEFEALAEAYELDAPVFLPAGSVRCGKGSDYAHTTTTRPGSLL